MDSLRYYKDKQEWGVSVKIQEGILDDNFWLIVHMKKDDNNNYVISFIAVDA